MIRCCLIPSLKLQALHASQATRSPSLTDDARNSKSARLAGCSGSGQIPKKKVHQMKPEVTRWEILAIGLLIQCIGGVVYAFSMYSTDLKQHFNMTQVTFSYIHGYLWTIPHLNCPHHCSMISNFTPRVRTGVEILEFMQDCCTTMRGQVPRSPLQQSSVVGAGWGFF